MMMRYRTGILLLLSLAGSLFSQKIGPAFTPGAKVVGIGRNGVAGIYDPSALFWNPASLGALHSHQLSFFLQDPYTVNYVSYAHFFPTRGALAVQFGKTGIRPNAVQFTGLGLSYQVSPGLYFGGSLRGSQLDRTGWTTAGLGFLFKPEESIFNKVAIFNSPYLADRLAIGISVMEMPLGNADSKPQTRAGITTTLPYAATLYYSRHFYQQHDISHLGLSYFLSQNVQLFGGLQQFDPKYWAFGVQVQTKNLALSLTFDRLRQRAIFTTTIRLGPSPQILSDREYQTAKELLQLKDRRGAYRAVKRSLAYQPGNGKSIALATSLKPMIKSLDQQVDTLLKKAIYWEQQQKFVNAAANYLKILKIDPRNKRVEEAIAIIRPRVNYQTNIWFSAAEKLYKDGELAKAKEVFESILLIRPTHSKALDYINKIQAIYKKEAEERYFRGLGFYSQRNLPKAREEFQAILAIDPDHKEAQSYLERISRDMEANKKRVSDLLAAARNNEARGSLRNARQQYQSVLAIEPANAQAAQRLTVINQRISRYVAEQFLLGEQAFKNNQYNEAQKYFKRVLSMQGGHAGARRYLRRINEFASGTANQELLRAESYYQQRDWSSALAVLDSLLAVYPDHKEATRLRQQTLSQVEIANLIESAKSDYLSGQYIEALKVFDSILEKDPDNEEAKKLREMSLNNLNEQVDEIFNQGIRLYTDEKYQLAIEEFDRILSVNPSHKGAQEYKTRAMERIQALKNLR